MGDLVLSKDEKTGKINYKEVKQLFRNKDKQIYNLTTINQDGQPATIGTTAEHPFWVDGKGWVNAKDLKANDKLTSANGQTIKVFSIELDDKRQDTYNFEVADYHTYFVGDDGVWVHNDCGSVLTNKVAKQLAKNPQLEKAFGKAIDKGLISSSSRGQAGIKAITKKGFTHEVKILGKLGNRRLFGNQLADGTFKWSKLGNHL